MSPVEYQADPAFASIRDAIVANVHPARRRVLHIYVHFRTISTESLNAVAFARDYARFLQLDYDQIPLFARVSRGEARCACANVAEYELVMGDHQMPRGTAVLLAEAWLQQFDERATFLLNSRAILMTPPSTDLAPGLFYTDLNAGVVAVTAAKVGLFWNAENS